MTNQNTNTTKWQYGIPTQEQLKYKSLLYGGSWRKQPNIIYCVLVRQRQVSEFRGIPIWFLILDDVPFDQEPADGRTAKDN